MRSTGQADPSIAAAAPAELKAFYSQKVIWEPCEDKLQCAKVKVPVDYAKPAGDTIELAAVKIASTGDKKGQPAGQPGRSRRLRLRLRQGRRNQPLLRDRAR